tara:strand:+ start:191 stop:463 length:273 start_codon:yes stop_codon:yes gene_type:complete
MEGKDLRKRYLKNLLVDCGIPQKRAWWLAHNDSVEDKIYLALKLKKALTCRSLGCPARRKVLQSDELQLREENERFYTQLVDNDKGDNAG